MTSWQPIVIKKCGHQLTPELRPGRELGTLVPVGYANRAQVGLWQCILQRDSFNSDQSLIWELIQRVKSGQSSLLWNVRTLPKFKFRTWRSNMSEILNYNLVYEPLFPLNYFFIKNVISYFYNLYINNTRELIGIRNKFCTNNLVKFISSSDTMFFFHYC